LQEGEQPDAVDEPELEGETLDLLEAELHGHKGRAILEALKAGGLPAELLAVLKATAKVNGQEIPVTLKEALEGYQRTSDYTRGKQELQTQRRQVQEKLAALDGMITGWDSGDKLLAGLRRLGKGDAFRQAAISYAREELENKRLMTENPAAYQARLEAKAEREKREALEEKLRTQPDVRAERAQQQFAEQLQSLVFPAFEQHSIKDTPFARERFGANFRAIYDSDGDLAEQVQLAARATAEELSDLAARFQASQQAHAAANGNGAPKPQQLPGRSQAAPQSATRPPKRMTPGEMTLFLDAKRRAARR